MSILYSILHKEKLLYGSQYGFRNKYSTECAALEIVDRLITEMDNGETQINIYLDLSKAFDILNHNIVLHKLEYYGVQDISLNLLKKYLNNRKEYVENDGVSSEMQNITTGVPQGSNLGPLLFIVYINMSEVSKILSFIMYADDTTLSTILKAFQSGTQTQHTDEVINSELDKISNWLIVNKLSPNVTKTKFSIFHKKKPTKKPCITALEIKLQNVIIERVTNFNFLGLILNENVSWKPHCDKISNNISKSTFNFLIKEPNHFKAPKFIIFC